LKLGKNPPRKDAFRWKLKLVYFHKLFVKTDFNEGSRSWKWALGSIPSQGVSYSISSRLEW